MQPLEVFIRLCCAYLFISGQPVGIASLAVQTRTPVEQAVPKKACAVDGVEFLTVSDAINKCGAGSRVKIPAGKYDITETLVPRSGQWIDCDGPDATILNWTGARDGTLIQPTVGAARVWITGCQLTTSELPNAGTAIQLRYADDDRIDGILCTGGSVGRGFAGCIGITGDGKGTNSGSVRILNSRLINFTSFGVRVDHALDTYLENVSVYSSFENARVVNLLIETGVSGFYASNVSTGFGLHGLLVSDTGQGGRYGGAPSFLFFSHFLADTTPGGSACSFDASLAKQLVSSFFTDSWCAAAGLDSTGKVITKTADGLEIKGGQGIVFQGRVRANARNGVFIDSANVSDVRVHDSFITGNNMGNDPDGNGFYLASPSTNISLLNSTVSNFPKTGAQRYGVKIAAPGATNLQIENNNLTDNSEGPLANESAGLYSVWGNRPDGINFLPDARIGKLTTLSCFSVASPANCGSAAAGSVAVSGIHGTEMVKTTAVTADSQILLTFDSSLGPRLGVKCSIIPAQGVVSAREPGESFTITAVRGNKKLPGCFSYQIVN